MKAIFKDYAGELSPEEYKELMAALKKSSFLDFPLCHPLGIKIFQLIFYSMSERAQRGHETAGGRSKPSDFPFSLPANNIPEQCKKLTVLVSTDKTKDALGSQLSHKEVKGLKDNEVEKL